MHLHFRWLLEFSSSFLALTLATRGSVNSSHSELYQDNWCSQQDTQQVEEPEAPQKRRRGTQQDNSLRHHWMEEANGHHIEYSAMWLQSYQCGLCWKTGRWWLGGWVTREH